MERLLNYLEREREIVSPTAAVVSSIAAIVAVITVIVIQAVSIRYDPEIVLDTVPFIVEIVVAAARARKRPADLRADLEHALRFIAAATKIAPVVVFVIEPLGSVNKTIAKLFQVVIAPVVAAVTVVVVVLTVHLVLKTLRAVLQVPDHPVQLIVSSAIPAAAIIIVVTVAVAPLRGSDRRQTQNQQ